jgi:hypothetical protein
MEGEEAGKATWKRRELGTASLLKRYSMRNESKYGQFFV